MMAVCKVGVVNEDSAFSVMGRVHLAGANATQSDISSIEYQIFYTDSDTAHTTATALTVSSVIFNTLQTDGRWTEDNTGYNFRHDVASTILTDPTRKYEIEYKFTPVSGSPFYLDPVPINVKGVKSS